MEDIDEFLKTSKDRIQKILNKFQWTEEEVMRDFNTNSAASMKEKNLELVGGREEPYLPVSCSDSNSVVLGNAELQKLLGNPMANAPEKFSDLQINFSREEKLLLYEHTVKQKSGNHFLPCVDDELVSFADIVAMKKREKRKRRKYRISKPTQTEEVRSLVELQMQALKEYLEATTCKTKSQETVEYEEGNTTTKNRFLEKQCYIKAEENKKRDEQKSRNSSSVYERNRRGEGREDRSKTETNKKKQRSRSRSRSRHRHKDRSESRLRHKSSHKRSRSKKRRKEKRLKEKHKKSHKSSSHKNPS